LFALYTSGSTGKPKGIVHTHGGYQVGIIATTKLVFDAQPGKDVLFVVATPGWITGQSYMIASSLLCRTPSIMLDGSPVSPPDRFAAIIARHKASILKAGSTFLRMLATREGSVELLAKHDLSCLRIGTFCAEPVNEAVHRFASKHLTQNYIVRKHRPQPTTCRMPYSLSPVRVLNPLAELVLGNRTRWHGMEPMLRERRSSAAAGHSHVAAAVDSGRDHDSEAQRE
jgi:acyl-CoA synthetase (AMP-forming)/AMP-acid ligase II